MVEYVFLFWQMTTTTRIECKHCFFYEWLLQSSPCWALLAHNHPYHHHHHHHLPSAGGGTSRKKKKIMMWWGQWKTTTTENIERRHETRRLCHSRRSSRCKGEHRSSDQSSPSKDWHRSSLNMVNFGGGSSRWRQTINTKWGPIPPVKMVDWTTWMMMNIDVLVVIDQFESIVQHESYQVTFIFIYSCHNVLRKVNKKKVVSIHCVISERMKWVSKWTRFATEHAYRSFPISSFDLRF